MSSVFEKIISFESIKDTESIIRGYVTSNRETVYYGFGAAAVAGLAIIYGPSLRQRFFAWFNSQAIKAKDEKYDAFKREILAKLSLQTSSHPELQKAKGLKILEIGAGVGTNFKFYPDGSHLTVVDPNPYFADYYNAHRKNFPNIHSENIIVSTGEKMDMVDSNSVDAVVVTLVLCSVQDIAKVISQIKRVLVPGGKFYFVEHIQEWDRKLHGYRWVIQHILTGLGFWPGIFDGCCLNRDPLPYIQSVGFSNVEYEKKYAPVPIRICTIVSPQLRGVATK